MNINIRCSLSEIHIVKKSSGNLTAGFRKTTSESVEYVCELKFDGASISITYRNGSLSWALTRGDGNKGDDVTLNVKTIKVYPGKLPVKDAG